jgi:hypothetical protein
VAKLCALREKDRNFVGALLDAGLVDAADLVKLLADVPEPHSASADRARAWLSPWVS